MMRLFAHRVHETNWRRLFASTRKSVSLSVDGTHVAWYGFRAGQRSDYTGKEGYPTIVFGVTVDHKYKIMHATRALPGSTNDSLVMLEDEFHSQTMARDLYQNFEFECMTRTVRKSNKRACTRCATVDTAPRGILHVRSRTVE